MRGSDEYNYALGLKRAKSAKEALVSRGGINPSKIIIVSYGESSPLCTRDYSEECLSKNRRVEFKIRVERVIDEKSYINYNTI